MAYYADLHIHSKWSMATSRNLDLERLSIAACTKGISLLGTGDCTHPAWLKELQDNLCPAEEGIFRLRPDLEGRILASVPGLCRNAVRFMLQGEVSTVYKKQGKTCKMHHLVYVPDLMSAQQLISRLAPFGALSADGRPTLLLEARNLLEIVLETHPDAFLVPAHIWTPWFSVLGSKTQFDSIEECYGELSSHIFALETGLSSDPPMNWRVSSLDRFQLVSNSDAHSASKIGRKSSKFSVAYSFHAIRNALATGDGFEGTIEMYPEEGKYYLDGHRKCGFSCMPEESSIYNGRCPCCNGLLTNGVLHRLESLADRDRGKGRPFRKPFSYSIPLIEILSELLQAGQGTKKVQNAYGRLIASLGSEISILTDIPIENIRSEGIPRLDEAIFRMRQGRVVKKPGFDGQYGTISIMSG